MADVKAIELKGIVHNATKIGVQDGQAEDIVNLRLKDGAWRAAGDGKLLNLDVSGYTNIYIHTNVYRHMLGVKGGKLYWFATASESDPNAFTAITPVEICSADVTTNITQNGNLLSMFDESTKMFVYALFMTNSNTYNALIADTNGAVTDRGIFPFGEVHFGYYAPNDVDLNNDSNYRVRIAEDISSFRVVGHDTFLYPIENAHNHMLEAFGKMQAKNRFTRPILACVAVKLYNGDYLYASAPQLVWPRQVTAQKLKVYDSSYDYEGSTIEPMRDIPSRSDVVYVDKKAYVHPKRGQGTGVDDTFDVNCPDGYRATYENGTYLEDEIFETVVNGADLVLSISDVSVIESNKEVFTDICVFVTPEIDMFDMSQLGYKNSWAYDENETQPSTDIPYIYLEWAGTRRVNYPARKSFADMKYDMEHSGFYLLRSYKSNELSQFKSGAVLVDLQNKEYEGVLTNIVQQDRLSSEAFYRTSFRPKYAYSYNGRSHYANYTDIQFHGFSIDYFQNNGCSLYVQPSANFRGKYKGFDGLFDDRYQYYDDGVDVATLGSGNPYLIVKTIIETSVGQQKVARSVVPLGNETSDHLYDLSPILSFPDSRAKKMYIYYVSNGVIKGKSFELTAHAYANVASYINEDFLPIKVSTFKNVLLGDGSIGTDDYQQSYE